MRTEDQMIADLFRPLTNGMPGAHGLLDDCATIAAEPGHVLVVKTDPVVAGVHFLADDTPEDIAWKALAVNVSDLAAKAAVPRAYLLALQLPEAFATGDWLERFARGLGLAQAHFGLGLIGGDTDRGTGPLTIGITVFGEARLDKIPLRTGAQPGDRLFVSGTIGDAALGLHLRTTAFARKFWPLDGLGQKRLLKRYLRPEPRLGLRQALAECATAAMDVSDGLVRDAGKLCRASGVGGEIRLKDVPFSPEALAIIAAVEDWRLKAVTGGDDYEILAAVPPERVAAFKVEAARVHVPVTEIGTVTAVAGGAAGCRLMDANGHMVVVDYQGWSHF